MFYQKESAYSAIQGSAISEIGAEYSIQHIRVGSS
jgi:hypothetical protein